MISPTGRMTRSNKENHRGFTFVEILIVVLIILLITSMAVPLFSRSFSRIQFQNTTENFVALCEYARASAVLKGQTLWICIDASKNTYWLAKYYNTESGIVFSPFHGKYGHPQKVPENISITTTEDKIPFQPDGESVEAEIVFRNSNNNLTTIEIYEISGKIIKT